MKAKWEKPRVLDISAVPQTLGHCYGGETAVGYLGGCYDGSKPTASDEDNICQLGAYTGASNHYCQAGADTGVCQTGGNVGG